MAIDYENILNKEQKAQLLNSRLSQLVVEGYQNSIGMKTAIKLGNQEQIDQIQNILNIIEVSILTHKEELDALMSEDDADQSE